MQAVICRLFYLGSNYHGSQWQPNVKTIQGELIGALSKFTHREHGPEDIVLSGRTDRGVHSFGQLVKFSIETPFLIDKINKHLPDDIILWAHRQIPLDFNPRYDVLFRHYRYYINTNPTLLSISAMKRATNDLIGTHDFTLLSKPDGIRPTSTTILNACMESTKNVLVLDIIGTNFLWKLVRKIVTILIEIGQKKYPSGFIETLLEGRNPLKGGIEPAPAEGLVFIEAIVPFHMKTSKNALSRVMKCLEQQGIYHRRLATTLECSNDYLFSYSKHYD